MKKIRRLARISLVLGLVLMGTACGTAEKRAVEQHAASEPVTEKAAEPCFAKIEWVDFLMINDIRYAQNYDGTKVVKPELLGAEVGRVKYMLKDNACTDHVTKNGDAAFLPAGTVIYALKGYNPEFRVVANNKVYEATENPNAVTMGDLLDIEGKVQKVSLESARDGSQIGDFSKEASSEFIRELLILKYVGFDAVYEQIKYDNGVFLRVHLKDGTSLRIVYYPKGNGFSSGAFGTEGLRALIMSQRAQIKAAAGL
ncbi:hypothetical protein G5B47_13955 [Paenibacillus sp. 7124]|uniref:Lipoprotein n=1 Tax=Paenibacillus apii TaxID=1850370 RepID=A0A6M1PMH0_9BACL|nr:hypothetical protein [Paenibacillus apii]NGM83522.1 hypothetical protein [Paenibacillus apii]NJJ40456.1 hypothetical protein [Paenibacillus apii]